VSGSERGALKTKVYITGGFWKAPILTVLDATGRTLNHHVKRTFFGHLYSLYLNSSHQYKGNNLSPVKIFFLGIRDQMSFVRKNFRLGVLELFMGYKLSIDSESQLLFPIRISGDSDSIHLWVSRAAAASGVYTPNLSIELDWSREKFARSYYGFVWYVRNVPHKNSFRRTFLAERESSFSFPRLTALTLNENTVHGELEFKTMSNCTVVSALFAVRNNEVHFLDRNHLIDNISWPTNLLFRENGSLSLLHYNFERVIKIEKGVLFGSSSSWFHFIVEILPRFLRFESRDMSQYTLIVRKELPQSILDILGLFNFQLILCIGDGDRVEVAELITLTDLRFSNELVLNERSSDLLLVRDFLLSIPKVGTQKVHIARPGNLFRKLLNQKDLEISLSEVGFKTVYPENLTASDQIDVFSQAEIVVAESGAAMTNVMFMHPQSLVVEIHPMDGGSGFWSEYCSIFGLRSVVIQGKQNWFRRYLLKSDSYAVDISKVLHSVRNS
jgi:hypothetical protein